MTTDAEGFKNVRDLQMHLKKILAFTKNVSFEPEIYLETFQFLLEWVTKGNAYMAIFLEHISKNPNQLYALLKILRSCTYPDILERVACIIYKCVSGTSKSTKVGRISIKQQLRSEEAFTQLMESLESVFHVFEKQNHKDKMFQVEYHVLSALSKLCICSVPELGRSCNLNSVRFACFKLLPFAVSNMHFRMFYPLILVLKVLAKNEKFSIEMSSRIFYDLLETGFNMLLSGIIPRLVKKSGIVATLLKIIAKHDDALNEMVYSPSVINILLHVLNNHNTSNKDDYKKNIRSGANILIKLSKTGLYENNKNVRLFNYYIEIKDASQCITSEVVCIFLVFIFFKELGKSILSEPSNTEQMEMFFKTANMNDYYIALLKILSVLFICCPHTHLPLSSTKVYSHPLPDNWVVEELDADNSDESDEEAEEGEDESDVESVDSEDSISKISETAEDILLQKDIELGDAFSTMEETTNWTPSERLNIAHMKILMSEFVKMEQTKSDMEAFKNIHGIENDGICEDIIANIIYNKHFIKTAHPDKTMAEGVEETHFLHDSATKFDRNKMLEKLMWTRNYNESNCQTVFNLDALINAPDNSRIEDPYENPNHLRFESRFEGGNLRRAIKINDFEYNLFMTPDVNCASQRQQWFYFEVSNMLKDNLYTFHIVNFDKLNSQFNNGMQPVLYSMKTINHETNSIQKGWMREGINIAYYCNNYYEQGKKTSFKTLTFSVQFPYSDDICYIAYHYPYSYTRLMNRLYSYENKMQRGAYIRCNCLCRSVAGNEVPLVTITSNEFSSIKERPLILLTSRVHPGEPNASWIMEGILDFLTGDDEVAISLREKYIFKIVPMLNVDGVMYGNYRNGISGQDMNRCWKNSSELTPEILHFKELVKFCKDILKLSITAYIDIHGHSRKKNYFLYGCYAQQSWKKSDKKEKDISYRLLPQAFKSVCKSFNIKACKYRIDKNKESTGRVAMWREFGVKCSYTLECTYCGYDQGDYENCKITPKHLKEIGASMCIGISAANLGMSFRKKRPQQNIFDTDVV